MKLPILPLSLLLVFVCLIPASAQKRKPANAVSTAVVIDESLSVLRTQPSLYARPIQRMRLGRRVQILGRIDADGVNFYKVAVPPSKFGWLQSDAVAGRSPADEARFVRLVGAADGFGRLQLASEFLQLYPASQFRPAMLLLFGDLLEDAAEKLSRDARMRV